MTSTERLDPVLARGERMARVRDAMRSQGVDALLCSLGADLPWLSGYEAMPLERITLLVVPVDDEATLVVPELEAPRVAHDRRLFALRPWKESEDPIGLIASIVGDRRFLAISDRTWAAHLLALGRALPSASFVPASRVTSALRSVKDPAEIAALQAAGAAADRVAAALLAGEIGLVGRTEAEVSRELGERLVAEGHAKVNFAIVGSGPNSASPHHEPGERRIGPGEPVVCDFGGTLYLDDTVGYCSDITRTVVAGGVEPAPEFLDLYRVLEEAQRAALEAAVVGTPCERVDAVGREIIAKAGYGDAFIHRIGHGIGIEEHEDPYMVSGNDSPLVAGNAFSVEPGIYLKGRFGARIEDIVVADEAGPLACNAADHSLHVVD
ncbi:MAG TPA: aminopeptidase P family protein [Acidimicrobiales bacterium]|nr:aminopeptidase P family protein [Acidimicrobiales bacterium]